MKIVQPVFHLFLFAFNRSPPLDIHAGYVKVKLCINLQITAIYSKHMQNPSDHAQLFSIFIVTAVAKKHL